MNTTVRNVNSVRILHFCAFPERSVHCKMECAIPVISVGEFTFCSYAFLLKGYLTC